MMTYNIFYKRLVLLLNLSLIMCAAVRARVGTRLHLVPVMAAG